MVVGEILPDLLRWIVDFLGLAVSVNKTATATTMAVAATGIHLHRLLLL